MVFLITDNTLSRYGGNDVHSTLGVYSTREKARAALWIYVTRYNIAGKNLKDGRVPLVGLNEDKFSDCTSSPYTLYIMEWSDDMKTWPAQVTKAYNSHFDKF